MQARGAEVVLAGDSYSDAQAHCDHLVAETGLTFIHPFDDPLVIAGQGTVGDEIVRHRQGEALHAVFVPVGGGGLIAGIAGYIKAVLPDVRVIGVEPFESDAMYQSLQAGRRVTLDHVGIFADGVAVRTVGVHSFADRAARRRRDRARLERRDLRGDQGHLRRHAQRDGAGRGARRGRPQALVAANGCHDEHLVAILSGANMNFDRLRFVAERAELGEEREALFAVTIPERPGAYRDFCVALGQRVVTEFNYRLNGRQEAHIFVGVGIDSRHDAAALARELNARGYETLDLTDNEMAKLHIRHMVGGAAPDVRDERLYRFEFPERPGALIKFLDTLGGRWNISLFHYRNHGADFGRVLVGFEVPDEEEGPFGTFLETLGYPYQRELDNPAYKRFLTPGRRARANSNCATCQRSSARPAAWTRLGRWRVGRWRCCALGDVRDAGVG